MTGTKYNSYEEAVERESAKKLANENAELESRKKLNDTMNTYYSVKLFVMVLALVLGGICVYGLMSGTIQLFS